MNRVPASPYEIYEILAEVNNAHKQPRMKLRIGSTGKTRSYATLNITTQPIVGVFGKKSRDEVTLSMKNSGSIEIPTPTYCYMRSSQMKHGGIDICRYNDWIQQDLGELIYVDRLGEDSSDRAFMYQVGGCACRYRTKYKRGVVEKGQEWVELEALQIGRVEVRNDILKKQLESDDIPAGLSVGAQG